MTFTIFDVFRSTWRLIYARCVQITVTTGTVTVECGWEDSLVDVFDGLAQLK